MKGVPLFVLLAVALVGIVAYLAGRARNRPSLQPLPIRATAPARLTQIDTPKDLCCCHILGEGETGLSEALEGYVKAKDQGDHEQACLKASCVVDEYNMAVNRAFHSSHEDLAYLVHWREVEKAECAAAGYLPPQH
jgi:hypothetical protein